MKKNYNMAFGDNNKNHIIIGMKRTKGWDQQKNYWLTNFLS
jgi:hypothetical protein